MKESVWNGVEWRNTAFKQYSQALTGRHEGPLHKAREHKRHDNARNRQTNKQKTKLYGGGRGVVDDGSQPSFPFRSAR